MCAAALGRLRTDDVGDLAQLWMGVRVDHQGIVAFDYQTVEGVPDTLGKGAETIVSYRWYLADAVFLVVLAGDGSLVESLGNALVNPAFQLGLGRKSYVPTQPMVLGLEKSEPEEILRSYPWLVSARRIRDRVRRQLENEAAQIRLRTVCDCQPDEASVWYADHPVSFEPRRFLRRPVRVDDVPLDVRMLEEEVLGWKST